MPDVDVFRQRSELEERFLVLCREAGLPPPAVNVRLAGHEVDMAWADRRLVVELDGFAYHRTHAAFERDRARDASLQLAGHRVLRVTARRLARETTSSG
jgi:very-short-patch-repair endonuclease